MKELQLATQAYWREEEFSDQRLRLALMRDTLRRRDLQEPIRDWLIWMRHYA